MKIEAPLLLIDYQEKLMPHIKHGERVITNASFLLKSWKVLGLPVLYSEQYPKGLGETVAAIRDELEGYPQIEKMSFSCACEADFSQFDELVVAGVETHVCVFQTVFDLVTAGKRVYVAEDACGSRYSDYHKSAIATFRQLGAIVVPAETLVYTALEKAGTESFKKILPLVKEKDELLSD